MLGYLLFSGVTTGALYALVALGLVVVFKATTVVNFAHGDLFMIGGFLAYTLHVMLQVPYVPALALAVVLAFGVGMLTDRIAFRPLMKSNMVALVLATVGFSFMLKGIGRAIWGGRGDYLPFPPLVGFDPIMLPGDIVIIPQQLVVLAGALAVMLAFAAFFRLTRAGKMMQATADNAKAATLVGIRTERVYMLTFGVGAAVAAAAAALMAPLTLLYPDIGFALFIKGFAAAVLGGLTSLPGAVVGGVLVGVIESLAAGYIDSSFLDVSAFVVIMAVLVVKPTGLMGGRQLRRV
ncbi:MAG: branched-chain amino acid ABC transporter permease [Proteobacteria bacterium]|nr:branched-chain amino acid ABC transporter permease [Pseudomonadota bacterium]